MSPEIVNRPESLLVGINLETCLAETRTRELWQRFMPRRDAVQERVNEEFYSVQIWPAGMTLEAFTPHTRFVKWAAVEVSRAEAVPADMQVLTIPAGLYAVVAHQGTAQQAQLLLQAIYGQWLPGSGYRPDARPQFEIMAANYRPDDTAAREAIWIPIAAR